MPQPGPLNNNYDYGLGIDADTIEYMKESHVVQSRISPIVCYLLQRNPSGSIIGSISSPLTISSYTVLTPNARATIWSTGSLHPNLDPYNSSFSLWIDGVQASRIPLVDDLINNNEYALVKRNDLNPPIVEIVLNSGFDPTSHILTYKYSTIQPGIDVDTYKPGSDPSQSIFGWTQYLNSYSDDYQSPNQILIRIPLNTRDLVINEEGRVTIDEAQNCWTIWTPYLNDFDILIISKEFSKSGTEERYEIVNKQDSFIQKQLITQRFNVKLLEPSDPRYNISYSKT